MPLSDDEILAVSQLMQDLCIEESQRITDEARRVLGPIPDEDRPAYDNGISAGVAGTIRLLQEQGLLAPAEEWANWFRSRQMES